ncbi:MAG: type II toxin-antitoxin system VapC family toxin [Cytophagales bacterium]|nr:type II toxin-antitoxin system VapC family toxin [Cytophagales bacterium]
MIIYLDTSSLVKLYVQETDTDNVKSLINSAEVITTSIVAYPESRAAFARKLRSGVMSDEEYQKISYYLFVLFFLLYSYEYLYCASTYFFYLCNAK